MTRPHRPYRKAPTVNVARVWCGVMPRVGSGNHMYRCRDCRRVRRTYWAGFGVPVVWAYGAAIRKKWRVRRAARASTSVSTVQDGGD